MSNYNELKFLLVILITGNSRLNKQVRLRHRAKFGTWRKFVKQHRQ